MNTYIDVEDQGFFFFVEKARNMYGTQKLKNLTL